MPTFPITRADIEDARKRLHNVVQYVPRPQKRHVHDDHRTLENFLDTLYTFALDTDENPENAS